MLAEFEIVTQPETEEGTKFYMMNQTALFNNQEGDDSEDDEEEVDFLAQFPKILKMFCRRWKETLPIQFQQVNISKLQNKSLEIKWATLWMKTMKNSK